MMGQEDGLRTGFLPAGFQCFIAQLPGRIFQGKPLFFRQGPGIHIHLRKARPRFRQ